MKGDLYITETKGPRFALAIERLREGFVFIFDRVAFRLSDHSIECAMHATWDIANLTDERVREDFTHPKNVLSHLTSVSSDFATIVEEKPID